MSLTYEQIEAIADHMRSVGFDLSETGDDQIALMASCVLDALGIEIAE